MRPREAPARTARILALVTDGFGGHGGIAQHNRYLLAALASAPGVSRVVALPRLIVDPPGPLPDRLEWRAEAAGGKAAYVRALGRAVWGMGREGADVVVCGHLNLLPFAAVAAGLLRAKLVLVAHGVEAWGAPGRLKRGLAGRVDRLTAVSDFTRRRVRAWSGLPAERTSVVPNAIALPAAAPAPRRADLVARYGLAGRRVVLTVGRLSSRERYKGHDEVLAVLPALAATVPDVAYLVVGDGDDRPRLEARAHALGVADRVVFAGYVAEEEKAAHYHLADVFAMPGRGEGFGIVYLEAMAAGVPVIASTADASAEVVAGGRGVAVDPDDGDALLRVLVGALTAPPVRSPPDLRVFSVDAFSARWHALITDLLARA